MSNPKELQDNRRHNFSILDNEVIDSYDLDPYEAFVYWYLVRLAGNSNSVFPSFETIATKTKMSRAKAGASIASLIKKKLLARHSRAGYTTVFELLPVNKKEDTRLQDRHGVSTTKTGGVYTVDTDKDTSINTTTPPNPQRGKASASEQSPLKTAVLIHLLNIKQGYTVVKSANRRADSIVEALNEINVSETQLVDFATWWKKERANLTIPQNADTVLRNVSQWLNSKPVMQKRMRA